MDVHWVDFLVDLKDDYSAELKVYEMVFYEAGQKAV